MHQLTRHLAKHLAPAITVNAIAPGPFQSRMMRATLEAAGDGMAKMMPLKRIGRPEDMAGPAIFLASKAGVVHHRRGHPRRRRHRHHEVAGSACRSSRRRRRGGFPDPATRPTSTASSASGADLEPGTLLAAYRSGLFPMPLGAAAGPMAWWSPDPRGVLPARRAPR